ncbi:MAG: Holliday junction resolvase [Methanoregula sp.]|jgi:Holliday junction resolvase|uniref:Holliday junction resolvase n=1 Tax=Methanoregula sp. TaxID=2052170 RepID=UPI0025DFBF09|nr:Holliday junction resolvase [Methanoregula sp.]MCK9631942.1 Holliday junction resolvase [Methanoregula sp.]
MSDFEREIVHCLNRFFVAHHIQGFAYRLKQHKFTSQYVDVLVDSLNPSYYLSIECKSIIDRKLYFSQHFHSDKKNVHQVDAISDFLAKTGRIGYLAVEFRQGPGKPSEAFLIPWATVVAHFKENKGITVDDARAGVALSRSKGGYVLEKM